MIAIDDGLASGNFNAADWMFLIGTVLALVAAILWAIGNRTHEVVHDPEEPGGLRAREVEVLDLVRYGNAVGWLAVAFISFGLLQL